MRKLFTILSGILFLVACTEDPTDLPEQLEESANGLITRAVTTSSTQNPYSLANVQKAYNEMAAELNRQDRTHFSILSNLHNIINS